MAAIDSGKRSAAGVFLKLLSGGIKGTQYGFEPDEALLGRVWTMAEIHHVTALVFDGMESEAIQKGCPALFSDFQEKARNYVFGQAQRSADFLLLYDFLKAGGLQPLVVKGIVCRSLYPQPEHRPSSDEDLLIRQEDFPKIHEAMRKAGFSLVDPDQEIDSAFEVSYQHPDNHLYIEIHKALFPPTSDAYGDLNECFEGAFLRSVTQSIYGVTFHTLGYTDHLLYLILHAFKHFLHSGFGIRQVCDILLFSKAFREQIDWTVIQKKLTAVHAMNFAVAIFRIGEVYLKIDTDTEKCFSYEHLRDVDPKPLLKDILEGGLYGASSMVRLHSSNMTLHAALERKERGERSGSHAEKQGIRAESGGGCAERAGSRVKGSGGHAESARALTSGGKQSGSALRAVLYTAFLPLSEMKGRYRYLEKFPVLLPYAWARRICSYIGSFPGRSGRRNAAYHDTQESIRLGNERIRLLRLYHVIGDEEER